MTEQAPTSAARTRFVCGLIGGGIGRSLSPGMHEAEADRRGLHYTYRTVDITELGLSAEQGVGLIRPAGHLGFTGLNITHPCKRLAVAHVDELSPEAARIGAINTVVFTDGRAVGHNTDVTGFALGFRRDMPGADLGHVVQVGAGGAGAAVAHALVGLGVEDLTIVDVDEDRAVALASEVAVATGGAVVGAAPESLPDRLGRADGIVNCTPVGMAHHPGLPFDPDLLRAEHWLVDVIYRPLVTELVRAARERGCRTATGAGMAIGQAAESFHLFTGVRPDPADFAQHFDRLIALEGADRAHP
ncbi:shikimate dehydrogenase [Ornithinimicrobium tianjinense]|uniref:Shikimate dehydrogenase (NADP(+)) n=1 Tax=Ornithinimicrobium tianjinense TaxID=1195761 RepID=A0A917BGX3_9MICO|nr:shikimate dehydrogenase [Ornithinimicrobium tianjinense]GGF40680.1 shikimate dehydrogenase (NADP(+)) [Ornithinimicrobium tianjinense]